MARLEAWAGRERVPGRPLVWLHGASAGELTGAAPVAAALRARRDLQLLVTYFSPSAEPVLGRLRPDVAEVLPLDTRRETRAALRAVRPDVLVFAKGDVWPNLTGSAAEQGVPLALVNAAVRPGSSRLRAPGRWILGDAYGRIDRVGAASEADARRLRRLGVREGAVTVTGDAAADEALERVRRARASDRSPAARLGERVPAGVPVLVAGSTWEADEETLLRAAGELGRRGRPVQLVLVPHEPGPGARERIGACCRSALGTAPRFWSEEESGEPGDAAGPGAPGPGDRAPPRPLVVDRVGILAGLYPAADVAWVGGGFGEQGLHSVVEPAAAGVPVLFGDRSSRREARELAEAGGGAAVPRDGVAAALERLLADREARRRTGAAARACVASSAGAAEAGAQLIRGLLPG